MANAPVRRVQDKYARLAAVLDRVVPVSERWGVAAHYAPEQQCMAVLSFIQLICVWMFPLLLLFRCAKPSHVVRMVQHKQTSCRGPQLLDPSAYFLLLTPAPTPILILKCLTVYSVSASHVCVVRSSL